MPVLPSYRNQSTDWHSKSLDWFLHEEILAVNELNPSEYLNNYLNIYYVKHCIQSVRIQSYSGPYFPHSD